MQQDAVMSKFSTQCEGHSNLRMVITGQYSADEIGKNCYHGSLGLAENVLWHIADTADDIVVLDHIVRAIILDNAVLRN
jgi:hypothetical protein